MGVEIVLNYFQDLTEAQILHFKKLEELYQDWNQKINVVSRKDIDELYLRHVLHSLGIAKIQQFNEGAEILDVGTGGGFPGIPVSSHERKNGILYLKGGDLTDELKNYKNVTLFNLSDYFEESFFETKKVVYLPQKLKI